MLSESRSERERALSESQKSSGVIPKLEKIYRWMMRVTAHLPLACGPQQCSVAGGAAGIGCLKSNLQGDVNTEVSPHGRADADFREFYRGAQKKIPAEGKTGCCC